MFSFCLLLATSITAPSGHRQSVLSDFPRPGTEPIMLSYTQADPQVFDWTVTLRGVPPNPGANVQLSTTSQGAFDVFPATVTVFGTTQGSFWTQFKQAFSGTVGVGAYNDGGSYAALATHGLAGRFPLAITQVGFVNAYGIVKVKLKVRNPHLTPGTAYLTYVPADAFAPSSGNINPANVYINGPSATVTVQLEQSLYPGSRVALGCLYQGATSAAIIHN